ncbi:hypothetical protein BZA05DRAFT_336714 [Tricharina praecox]|uniref:uncharacterized protein n=1 Tax=Tricharina praecox TaxID=43433 RepID=UPI0022204D73|nr:uncharacterized protein BZA05DRAFT_336714 [Tricharina praecox]KAI5853552.1 hypothetical protein BZA05DRAFT_336714 [Tricharina praecox]
MLPQVLRRTFSTTPRRLVGPESPQFIEVPRAHLPRVVIPFRPKGILPVPRTIFPETRPDKGTAAYLKKTIPKPRTTRATPSDSETRAFQEWQAAMATKRRSNLREGLHEIKERKEHYEEKRATAFKARSVLRDQALEKALRNDVRLTLPSVLSTTRLQEKGLPDPRREERLREMSARRKQILKERSAERQSMVHELYMSAGDFILTEAQLDKAIDEKFKDMDLKIGSPATRPPTVREMLVQKDRISKGEGLNIDDSDNVILEVGGALTGGRMPVSATYLGNRIG